MGRRIGVMGEGYGAAPRLRAAGPPGSAGDLLNSRNQRERAFAAAGRRSGRVRFLRRAILVGVVAAIGSVAAIWIFNPFRGGNSDLSFASLGIEGTKVAVARPKLSGFRNDGQAYFLTAERALQDVKQPTRLELQKLTGEIGTAAGETTHISADGGVYDSAAEHMRLADNIRISNGRFEIRLQSADIDFKTGRYRSDQPVEVRVGPGTTIHADRAEAQNNGQELVFDGRVRTTMIPQAGESETDAKGNRP